MIDPRSLEWESVPFSFANLDATYVTWLQSLDRSRSRAAEAALSVRVVQDSNSRSRLLLKDRRDDNPRR